MQSSAFTMETSSGVSLVQWCIANLIYHILLHLRDPLNLLSLSEVSEGAGSLARNCLPLISLFSMKGLFS